MRFRSSYSVGLCALSAVDCNAILLCSPAPACLREFCSQLVVEATLVHIEELHPKVRWMAASIAARESDSAWRKVETVQVYEENSSGRASFDWVPGRRYLLFLLC